MVLGSCFLKRGKAEVDLDGRVCVGCGRLDDSLSPRCGWSCGDCRAERQRRYLARYYVEVLKPRRQEGRRAVVLAEAVAAALVASLVRDLSTVTVCRECGERPRDERPRPGRGISRGALCRRCMRRQGKARARLRGRLDDFNVSDAEREIAEAWGL